jgi:hypothetical protein
MEAHMHAPDVLDRSEAAVSVAEDPMPRSWLSAVLVVLVLALIALVGVLLLGNDDVSLTAGEPEIVTVDQLSSFASDADAPVYWLGERNNVQYELTETSGGRVYVRYLSPGAEAGDKRAQFLAVGTYPQDGGVEALRRAVENREGAELGRTDDGAVLLIDPSSPNNAHLAYPGADLQIEVYSPVPGEALRIASAGDVRIVP